MNEQVLLKHRKRILSWIKDQPALSKPRDQLLKFNRFFILLTILLIVSAIGVFGFLFLAFPPINNPYPLLSFIGAFIVGMILTYKVREKLFIVLDDVFPSYAPSVIPNYGPFPSSKIYRQKFFAKKSYYIAVGLNMGVVFVFIAPIILFLGGSLLFTWVIIAVVYLGIQFICYLHILVINDEDQHNFAANIIIYNIIGISLFFLVPELFPGFPLFLTLLFEIPIASCFYYFLYVLNRASKHWRTKEVMESLLIALGEHFQTRDYVLLAEWGWITGHLGVLQTLLQQNPNFTLNENGTKLVKAKPTG